MAEAELSQTVPSVGLTEGLWTKTGKKQGSELWALVREEGPEKRKRAHGSRSPVLWESG